MAWQNLITDIAGVRVGNAHDERLGSGVTAIVFDEPVVASVDIRGGGPATREADLLEAGRAVERIDAIALSGGSAFGLDAGGGVQARLREQGRGFAVRTARVPIVPGAAIFDLLAGGDKDWGRFAPYRELGYTAAAAAAASFALGSVGAGLGATTADLKGGLGSASAATADGVLVGALAVANAAGSVVIGGGPCFWAAPVERDGEFGGRGLPAKLPAEALIPRTKGSARESTTLVVVVLSRALPLVRGIRASAGSLAGRPRPPNSPSRSTGAAQKQGPPPMTTEPAALATASAPTSTPSAVAADAEPSPPLRSAVVAPRPAPTLPSAKLVAAA